MIPSKTVDITFYDRKTNMPRPSDIKAGVIARNKMSGDWVKIPTSSYGVDANLYDTWAMASAFPNFSKYPAKYNDLVAAKEALKAGRYDYDPQASMGKAIGLIKRFLETHAK
jgi:hypothetical protein